MRQRFREHRAAAAGVLLAAILLASCGTRDDNGLGIGDDPAEPVDGGAT